MSVILKSFVTRNTMVINNCINNPNIYDLERGMLAEVYDDKPLLVNHKEPVTFMATVDLILTNPVQILIRNADLSRYVKLGEIKRVWL